MLFFFLYTNFFFLFLKYLVLFFWYFIISDMYKEANTYKSAVMSHSVTGGEERRGGGGGGEGEIGWSQTPLAHHTWNNK